MKMNNVSPVVSIIIQAYNEQNVLSRSVDSVLTQTFADFELVLIDNGSSDATAHIMDAYAQADTRVRVLHLEENQGYEYWLAHLRELVSGVYFASLDADDWLEPEFLECCVEAAETDGSDIVCTLNNYFDAEETLLKRSRQFSKRECLDRTHILDWFERMACLEHVWAKLFRTSLLKELEWSFLNRNIRSGSGLGLDGNLWWDYVKHASRISLCPEYLHNCLADHDITMQGYCRRLPLAYRCAPIILDQEYELLESFGEILPNNRDSMLTEYLVKMTAALETYLDPTRATAPAEALQKILDIYYANAQSVFPSLLKSTTWWDEGTVKSIQEQGGNSDFSKWVSSAFGNSNSQGCLGFSLCVLQFLLQQVSTLQKEKAGLEATVSALEHDRTAKDAALAEREETIRELISARAEKDTVLAQQEESIQELIRARSEKGTALAQQEETIQELIRARVEKDTALAQREETIRELIRERDEKDATLAQREETIRELIRVRDEKDAALAQRDEIIQELIQMQNQEK